MIIKIRRDSRSVRIKYRMGRELLILDPALLIAIQICEVKTTFQCINP